MESSDFTGDDCYLKILTNKIFFLCERLNIRVVTGLYSKIPVNFLSLFTYHLIFEVLSWDFLLTYCKCTNEAKVGCFVGEKNIYPPLIAMDLLVENDQKKEMELFSISFKRQHNALLLYC